MALQSVRRHDARVHVTCHRGPAAHLIEGRRHAGHGAQLRVVRHRRRQIFHIVAVVVRRRWAIALSGVAAAAAGRRTAHLVMVVGALHATVAAHQVGDGRDGRGAPDGAVRDVRAVADGRTESRLELGFEHGQECQNLPRVVRTDGRGEHVAFKVSRH